MEHKEVVKARPRVKKERSFKETKRQRGYSFMIFLCVHRVFDFRGWVY